MIHEFSGPDPKRSRLRATVSMIERGIADSGSPSNGLLESWADLVEQLALGPEPEVRECPVCKHIGMREATLCGYCWTKLTPLTDRDHVAE